MKFAYYVELKNGYRPVMELEEEKEVRITIEAPNRATADRMVSAMLKDAPNIDDIQGICIED